MSKPQRYVPGPGEPALPPQLTEFQDKTTDEVLEELNRMPFFMNKLDDSNGNGGSNVELEALRALAYDGEPHEVADNFRKNGNDLFKAKRYKEARDIYNKGIEVNCNDNQINGSLYLNRAACELLLKNYRRCINDCQKSLEFNALNSKAYYRMARALFALEKNEDALEATQFGLKVDPENDVLKSIVNEISKKIEEIAYYEQRKLDAVKEKQRIADILESALAIRNIENIDSTRPAEMLVDAKVTLENPEDIETQLIFPAMVMYPTTDEFDFIAQVSELSTPQDVIDIIMSRPQEWFEQPGHENFTEKKIQVFMETVAGGLIKVGKKANFNSVLGAESPRVTLFDNALRLFFVPKPEVEGWIAKWDKVSVLERRK